MTSAEKWETVQRLIGGDITSHDLNDLSAYNFNDGQTPPTEEEVEADFIAHEYIQKRKAEYPSIEELVVAMYDDQDKAALINKRAAIKAKYPKG